MKSIEQYNGIPYRERWNLRWEIIMRKVLYSRKDTRRDKKYRERTL